jgi:hypothetical protein
VCVCKIERERERERKGRGGRGKGKGEGEEERDLSGHGWPAFSLKKEMKVNSPDGREIARRHLERFSAPK